MLSSHTILYAHGFAVDKESRGLFTDIAASMPTVRHELIDLNTVDDQGQLIHVNPVNLQVAVLKRRLSTLLASLPADGHLDMVCHSLGCVVAALAAGTGVRRIILIAPPSAISTEYMQWAFKDHPRVSMNLGAESVFARKDGVKALVPPEYWPSLEGISPERLYQRLAELTDLYVITAAQDEQREHGKNVLHIAGAHEYELPGNHNFTHAGRKNLIATIKSLLL